MNKKQRKKHAHAHLSPAVVAPVSSDNNPSSFNPDELCTIAQARDFVARVNRLGIGGGVAPEQPANDYHNDVSGIYLPPWTDVGNDPEARTDEARPFLMRFNHGTPSEKHPDGFQAAGFNIGSLRATARNHAPPRAAEPGWAFNYAIEGLTADVNEQIAGAEL